MNQIISIQDYFTLTMLIFVVCIISLDNAEDHLNLKK